MISFYLPSWVLWSWVELLCFSSNFWSWMKIKAPPPWQYKGKATSPSFSPTWITSHVWNHFIISLYHSLPFLKMGSSLTTQARHISLMHSSFSPTKGLTTASLLPFASIIKIICTFLMLAPIWFMLQLVMSYLMAVYNSHYLLAFCRRWSEWNWELMWGQALLMLSVINSLGI